VTIKSDRWIRRMAQEHGMIEPFVDGQVRDGVISYGNSSYGYDMRIANEFKVFTNVFNTLVDPKHFDPRSFVDITADHCDIPPNSFALARSGLRGNGLLKLDPGGVVVFLRHEDGKQVLI